MVGVEQGILLLGFSGPMFLVMAPVLVFRCSASRREAHIMLLAATPA